MEVDVNKTFKAKFPEATVKFLVGSEEVKKELKEVLGRLQSSEENRVNAEDIRVQNEEERSAAEATRESNESSREAAERVRENAEENRVNAEDIRVQNEEERVAAEQKRTEKDIERGVLLQEHGQKIGEHTQSISDIESDLSDLSDAPRVEVDNARYKTVHVMDRASGVDIYPITIPEAVIDKDGKNIIEIIEKYWAEGNTEADVMYGVEWDVTVADPAMTRIGNMALHRQLPIQNRMKGCLLDDNGKVVEYLPPTSWLGATRDGSRGQVEVELPDHYRKFETDGNIRRAKISEYPLPGYHYVPKMYISAYEATVQRSTHMLCSVVNSDPDYRGGKNDASFDGTYRSLLGKPASGYTFTEFRRYARARNNGLTDEWNIQTYDAYKTLCWLFFIEYANRDSALPFNAERDINGFAQGGIGVGASEMPSGIGQTQFGFYPIVPCGVTDEFGNQSGTAQYDVIDADGGVHTLTPNRYRGVENPFGHIFKMTDSILYAYDEAWAAYIAESPSDYANEDLSVRRRVQAHVGTGFLVDIAFGEYGDITPLLVGGHGSSTTYWCDQIAELSNTGTVYGIATGGYSAYASSNGLTRVNRSYATVYGEPQTGTRLCFIPKNNE